MEQGLRICDGPERRAHLTQGLKTFDGFAQPLSRVLLRVAHLQHIRRRVERQRDCRLGGLVHAHVYLQSAPIIRAREALRHVLSASSVGGPLLMLPEGRRWVDTKDHAGRANPNLIAIVEGIGDARD